LARRFRDLSIRSKLMTGFMLTSVVALLITMAALAVYDRGAVRDEIRSDVAMLAGIIGENASSSLVFNDAQTAQQTLAALKAQPNIVTGALYDRHGKLFASYGQPPPAVPPRDGAEMTSRAIGVARPVNFSNARVGTVYVLSDLSAMAERRAKYLQIAALVLAGAAFIALLLSAAFQRTISRPIRRLLDVEKHVSRTKDYTLRAEKHADDEVGKLIDGFNEMLSEIRARDAEIFERHRQEMALARSIQTSVLPRTFELPGYDVCAIMMPAEEVGGDFYEFRPSHGGAWLGVGDVTGHGVTSGLIMMMAQSMFTMLVEQNGQASPARFLAQLNRAMYYNLRERLEQDKFMTMIAARIDGDGRFTYAGAHTDLLVWRARQQTVERLPTDGLWLGVAEEIEGATRDRILNLESGDVLLLHTDGVTEARNREGECFDLARLTDRLAALHDREASEIVTTIANQAWSWAGNEPADDVSVMVIKRR
jgi:serine phosphatase RsbU (regulator of sigma subunit)